ncbi:L-threonine ammonia-lyase [Desulfuromusa kysingii]|uniref:L-threonine ammonia-lyase n=1 Tax=Desulfuromusa kysingii TaxID=37625 RepID=A0A1H4E469_9BACT|nr:threonine ammonia-lyase [Desulfuromusa kysingii]SEA79706.1 L-threonine ammonia-lyase [Desulfuromusa kysingii]
MLTPQMIDEAALGLKGVVRPTEIIHSPFYSKMLGAPLYFKCENHQYTGSFKIRGAYNFLSKRPVEQLANGIITASGGNHGKGVASAALSLKCPCRVIMPDGTPLSKELATLQYGAAVELYGDTHEEAESYARQLAEKDNLLYVPAFDHELVMAGQGTIGLEILQELPTIESLFVPVGGGGLIAGIATAIKAVKPGVRIIGVEAAGVASASLARRNGYPKSISTRTHSFAEEVAVKKIGELTFPIIEHYVDEIITVDEESITRAIVSLMEKSNLVVEGAGAVSLAALIYGFRKVRKENTLCLLSGGNLDIHNLARVVEKGLLTEGRYLQLRLEIADIPGALAHLTHILSELKANIFQVSHDRHKSSLPLGEAEVLLDLETRGAEHIQEILMRLEDERYRPEVIS